MRKILMSAYACEPNRGSEPGVGWNWALQAALQNEVWVITRQNNRRVIEAELARNPQPNLHFIYHDLPTWASWWKRGQRGVQLYYYLWQLTAIKIVGYWNLHHDFDIAHHVTMVSVRAPSMFAWHEIPFVWGPLAGGESTPNSFLTSFAFKSRLWEVLRSLSNRLVKLDPFVRKTADKAGWIVFATHDTRDLLGESYFHKSSVVPAIGMDLASGTVFDRAPDSNQVGLKLIFVGNLLDLKGVHLALHAVKEALESGVQVQFSIVGDGVARAALKQLAGELDITQNVEFIGRLPAAEVPYHLAQADALIFPSLHDSGGFAVLEAMQAGLPVICLDLGGPGVSVTSETGIKVATENPKQAVSDLARAIVRLANDPDLRRDMGKAGRNRVRDHYSWGTKGKVMSELYARLIQA